MLFKGVGPLRNFNEFENITDYTQHLFAVNEQLVILLKLKKDTFENHLKSPSVQQSLLILVVSLILNLKMPKATLEEWQKDYISLLVEEIWTRHVKVLIRMLNSNSSFLCKSLDFSKWISIAFQSLVNEDLSLLLLETLFNVDTAKRQQFIDFLSQSSLSEFEDIYMLCMILAAAKVTINEFSISHLITLFIFICDKCSSDKIMAAFIFLSKISYLEDNIKEFVQQVQFLEDFQKDQLCNIFKESNVPVFIKIFDQMLKENKMSTEINRLVSAIPSLSISEAHKIFEKSNFNFEAALATARKIKGINEFTEFLDDKNVVNEKKEVIMSSLIDYEDEFDDSYGADPGQNKVEETISALETDLLTIYIQNTDIFKRSSAVRRSNDRLKLCKKLQLSHEQIEGWAIMLERNVL